MLTREKILETLRNDFDLDKYNIESLALFGSYANGKNNPNSDIDLLYKFKNKENIFRLYFELKKELEITFLVKVDLVPEKFMDPLKLSVMSEEIIYV